MKLVANSVTKMTMWISFLCCFQILYMNSAKSYSHKLSPKSKFAIFPAKPEKSNIREIKLPRKISRQTVNCERIRFSCNLSAFVSRFQQSRIRELRKVFGQSHHRECHRSLKPMGSGSSPGWGHCVVFVDKTGYFHGASLRQVV